MATFNGFHLGLNDAADPRELKPGELVRAKGAGFSARTTDALGITGQRAAAGSIGASPVGMLFMKYAAGDDVVVAAAGDGLYEAVAGPSLVWARVRLNGSDLTFDVAPTALSGAPVLERLIVAAGAGVRTTLPGGTAVTRRQNLMRRADGTWKLLGLVAPNDPPTVTVQTGVSETVMPNANSGDWLSAADAADADDTTGARGTLAGPTGSPLVHMWSLPAFTGQNHTLKVLAAGSGLPPETGDGRETGTGGGAREPIDATLLVEMSVLSGADGTWTEVLSRSMAFAQTWTQVAIPDGDYVDGAVVVRASVIYRSGSNPATGIVYTIKATQGASVPVDAAEGVRWLVTEYDQSEGDESSYSPATANTVLAGATAARLDFSPLQNSRTTHRYVYRLVNGGADGEYDKYGRIDQVPVSQDHYIDTFDHSVDEIADPTVPVQAVGQGADIRFYPSNDPPPLYQSIDVHQGSLIGVPVDVETDGSKSIYFSPPWAPGKRPALYNLPCRATGIPIAVKSLGRSAWLVLFEHAVQRVEGLPLVTNAQFQTTNQFPLSATRGTAGISSFCAFSVSQAAGGIFIFSIDADGFWVSSGYDFQEWGKSVFWKRERGDTRYAPALLAGAIASWNQRKRKVEVYYPSLGSFGVNERLDFYVERSRSDGTPVVLGAHPVLTRAVVSGQVSGEETRWSAIASGATFLEDSGLQDDSQAEGSTAITRDIETGRIAMSGLGMDFFLRAIDLKTSRLAAETITLTPKCQFSSGEEETVPCAFDPEHPDTVGVMLGCESYSVAVYDSGTGARADLIGYSADAEGVRGPAGGMRSGFRSTPGSTQAPR